MRKQLPITALVIALLLQPVVYAGSLEISRPEDVGMSSLRLGNVRDQFQRLLDKNDSGGFQILVARRGKVVLYESLGFANVEQSLPITEESLFRIYSMTKPVVGVAMMMLYEDGVFSLDDPLSKHVPEFAGLQVYAGEDEEGNVKLEAMQREPTMQDLLQHTAGFTYGIFGDSYVDQQYLDADMVSNGQSLQDFIDKLATIPLLFQPGTRWHYSVAVDVQGYLIEKWTGKDVGAFLKERLFDPLGMDQTSAWVPPNKASLLASIYTHDENDVRQPFTGEAHLDFYNPPSAFNGGAQLISSSDDYWRFCQMLLNGGEYGGKRYLSASTIRMMSGNRLEDQQGLPDGIGFGFNFAVVTDKSQLDYASSNGEYYWTGLASTIFWIDPEEELIAIALTQHLPPRGRSYSQLLHRLVHDAIID